MLASASENLNASGVYCLMTCYSLKVIENHYRLLPKSREFEYFPNPKKANDK